MISSERRSTERFRLLSPSDTSERQGQQSPEIHEASSSTACPLDNDVLRSTFNGRERSSREASSVHPSSTSPLLHEPTSLGDFEVVNHSDTEEEFILVESQPKHSEVNQSSFQKKVEAYQSNNVIDYMGKKSRLGRLLQENTTISLLNEQRLEQCYKQISADYSKRVDEVYEETRKIVNERYKEDIKAIKDNIEACEKKITEWNHTRDWFTQKLLKTGLKEKSTGEKAELKEKSAGEKAELKEKSADEKAELKEKSADEKRAELEGKLRVINEVIKGYKDDLATSHKMEKELRETAEGEISEISKLKVQGLQKNLDGFQQHLLVEQRYQSQRRDVMAMFGNVRSVFMARSLFRL